VDNMTFDEQVIESIKAVRKGSSNPTGTCPFFHTKTRCSTYCAVLFPDWAESVKIFVEDGLEIIAYDGLHPCQALGKHVVLSIMRRKFPELYPEY